METATMAAPTGGSAVVKSEGAQALQSALRYFRAGRLADATAQGQLAAEAGDAALRADAATLLARIARRQGKLDLALAEGVRAVQASVAAKDTVRECRASVQHAHALNALGLMEPALEESYRALRLAELSSDPSSEAVATEALGAVQWSMSQWPEAIASFQRMLEIGVAAGDLELQSIAHGGIGGAESGSARMAAPEAAAAAFERARVHALQYLHLATELGDAHAMRAASHNHAVVLTALGERRAARATLEALLAQADEDQTRALSLLNLAELDLHEGDPSAAVHRLDQVYVMLSETDDRGYLMGCCHSLCEAHELLGDTAAALRWHRQYHELYVRTSSEKAQMHGRALAVKYETSRAHTEAVLERSRAKGFERDSLEDSLTGIANRRSFDHAFAEAIAGVARGNPFSLALFDVDNFKRINDAHSHLVGDKVLRRVAQILASNIRRNDLAARYGGEEFGMVFAGYDADAARHACERMRCAIESENWASIAPGLEVRISAGCVSVDVHATAAELLAKVDARLYRAKANGRNRVVAEDAPS